MHRIGTESGNDGAGPSIVFSQFVCLHNAKPFFIFYCEDGFELLGLAMLACAQEVDFIEKKLKQAQGHLDFYLKSSCTVLE